MIECDANIEWAVGILLRFEIVEFNWWNVVFQCKYNDDINFEESSGILLRISKGESSIIRDLQIKI